ncbi:hypothetical protein MMC07_008927 [Pseudocyphellaria aurata]|nr:hypothetical protein [Pseudocyphellaria aurata]
MAKSRPIPNKSETKTILSTSALFKAVNRDKARKDKALKAGVTVKKKGGKLLHNSAVRKSRKTPNHSLAVAFTSIIEESRNCIEKQTDNAIDSTCQDLTQRLASSSGSFNETLQVFRGRKEEMFKPLGQDKLHFKSNDGKFKSTQTLGDRMRQFKNLVAAEEKQLEALWKEWAEVNQSIADLALEMPGSTRLEDVLNQSTGKLPDIVGPRRKATTEIVEQERKEWEDEITKMSKASVASMMAGEEEMNFLQRRRRNDLLKLLDNNI